MEVSPITPRDARKKQMNNGIYSTRDQSIPHAMEVSRARRQLADTGMDSYGHWTIMNSLLYYYIVI